MDLQDKSVLITGGSSGIGKAIAASLSAQGCRVAINGRHQGRLNQVAEELGCLALQGDVSVESDAQGIVTNTISAHGALDILVNNAGFGVFGQLVEASGQAFEEVWRTNVLGSFFTGQAAARHMIERQSGAIVNIASTAATKGFTGGSIYAASKFALRGMTECWRDELRRQNIRVMLINPSEVLTDFARRAGYDQQESPKKLIAEDIAHAVVSVLELDNRAFIPELAVFATNPF